MFAIFKKYRHLLSRRAADDFNRMAAFLTNFCGDQSIDFHRPDKPTAENPPSIRVNDDWLDGKLKDLPAPDAPSNPDEIPSGVKEATSVASPVEPGGVTFEAGSGDVKVNVVTRVAFDSSAVCFFTRPFVVKSDGRIYSIGDEAATTIAAYRDTSG